MAVLFFLAAVFNLALGYGLAVYLGHGPNPRLALIGRKSGHVSEAAPAGGSSETPHHAG